MILTIITFPTKQQGLDSQQILKRAAKNNGQ